MEAGKFGLMVFLMILIIALLSFLVFDSRGITGKAVQLEDPSILEKKNVEKDLNLQDKNIEEIQETKKALPEYHDTFLIYGQSNDQDTPVLIYERDLKRVDERNLIIKIKHGSDLDYRELAEYLSAKEIDALLIYPEDVNIGKKVKEETGVNVIVKFGKDGINGGIEPI